MTYAEREKTPRIVAREIRALVHKGDRPDHPLDACDIPWVDVVLPDGRIARVSWINKQAVYSPPE